MPVMHPCVLVPVYDNVATVGDLVRGALDLGHAVFVVDDGSTDGTAEVLAGLAASEAGERLTLITHDRNRGKGAALRTGWAAATRDGHSHVVSLDADGQHAPSDVDVLLAEVARRAAAGEPEALLIGSRDLQAAGAGAGSRIGNAISNFWTWVETGTRLPDTQSGLRCYPLPATHELACTRTGYDLEVEVLVKASWTGLPLVPVSVGVHYPPEDERVSHMRPFRDFLRIARLNTALVTARICLPPPVLALVSRREVAEAPRGERWRLVARELLLREPGSPARIAGSVALGLFMGIAPLWGFQIALTLVLAHLLNASKTVAVVASNISFPLMIPPILYGSLVMGRWSLGREDPLAVPGLGDDPAAALAADLPAYLLGSVLLGAVVAAVGGVLAWLVVRMLRAGGGRSARPGVLLAAGLVTLLAAVGTWRLQLDEDVSRLLPDRDPELGRVARWLRTELERGLIDVGGPVPAEVRHAAADELAEALRSEGLVADVRAGRQDVAGALGALNTLRGAAPRLLGPDALAELDARLAPDAVLDTLQTLERELLEPGAEALYDRVRSDPLGLRDAALAPLQALTAGLGDVRLLDGRLTSSDGTRELLIVDYGFPASDGARSQVVLDRLAELTAELGARHPGLEVRHLGSHRATRDNAQAIRHDVTVTTSLGMGVVALLALLCFRRPWVALLALTPAAFGGLAALGVLGATQGVVAAAVLGFGAVLVGLSLDFAVHVLFRLEHGGASARAPARALIMGATTTTAAFLCLRASSLPGLRDLGAFGAVGIPAAALFALFVLPQFVQPRADADQRRAPLDLSGWLARVRPGLRAVALVLLVTPVLGWGMTRLRFDADPQRLSSLSPAAAADETGLRATWGLKRLGQVVLTGAELQDVLARNDALATDLQRLVDDGVLAQHASVSGLLPARATQDARLAAWRGFWSDDRRAELSAALAAAADVTRFRADAFDPFLDELTDDVAPLDAEALLASPLADLLAGRVRRTDDGWAVATPVVPADGHDLLALDTLLRAEHAGAMLLDGELFVRRLTELVGGEMGLLGALALAASTLLVLVWIGRPGLSLVILLPLLVSLVWALGLLGWLGVPLDLVNAIFVVFLFGLAVDYSIFLAHGRLDLLREGVDHTDEARASVLLCALTTCAGFGALAFADHPVLRSIGVSALVGIGSAAVVCQLLVPPLARLLLVRAGPNGTPAVRNVLASLHVWQLMIGRGVWFLARRDKAADVGTRRAAAHGVLHGMGVAIRDDVRLGRRTHLDERAEASRRDERPGLVVANHESMYDIAALLAEFPRLAMVVKRWPWEAPLMGTMLREAGFVLAEGRDTHEVLAEARATVEAGASLALFPEGSRRRGGRSRRFKNGAFALARELGVPVHPVALVNSREVIPVGAWWVGDHDARIVRLPAMDPADFTGEGADRRMAREARARIRAACRAHWPQTQHGPRWFDLLASAYRYQGPLLGHYARAKARRDPLVEALPRAFGDVDGPLLVAGCGHGIMATRLALADPQRPLVAVDHDPRKLRAASQALGDGFPVRFVQADLRALTVDDLGLEQPLAGALLADVLHYWPEDTQIELLDRLAAVLPAGARLVVREGAAAPGPGHRLISAAEAFATGVGFTRHRGELHWREVDGWAALLEDRGFALEQVHPEWGLFSNVGLVATRKPSP